MARELQAGLELGLVIMSPLQKIPTMRGPPAHKLVVKLCIHDIGLGYKGFRSD